MNYIIGAIFLLGLLCIVGLHLVYKKSHIESPRLSEITASLQNVFIVFSIIATGTWVIYTFDALNQREEADLKFKELQSKIKDTESSTIKIDSQTVDYKTDYDPNQKGLIIEIEIVNKGNKRIIYDLTQKPLTVYKVLASNDQLGYTKKMEPTLYSEVAEMNQDIIKSKPLSNWISLTQSSRKLSYFVTVDANSLYYIVFSSKDFVNPNSVSSSDLNCANLDDCSWFVSKYVFIGDDNINAKH
jgi:hypothetical protein